MAIRLFFLQSAASFRRRSAYRKLHPQVTLYEMHTHVQMDAFKTGKIDVGFTRPLEPPYDRTLSSELLLNDPTVAVKPKDHPLARVKGGVQIQALAAERFVVCERSVTPTLFDSILALCSSAGFRPDIVNSSQPGREC